MIQGLRHIRAFLAVARLGSFTRAAAELNVSQPALTVQIRQLEETLGLRLFDRNKRRVGLTEAGKSLLVPLGRVVADLDSVLMASHDLAGLRRGEVTVATLPSVAANLLPAAIRLFNERFPGVVINVRDVVAGRIAQLVLSGDADFGIGSRIGPDRELEVADFLTDHMCAFYPAGHALAGRGRLTLRDVAAYPLILTSRDTSVRRLVERALAKDDLDIVLAADANYMSTAVGMVRAGLGVAILPESAKDCANAEGIVAHPIHHPVLHRKIGILTRAGRTLSPAAARFAEAVHQVAASPPSFFAPVGGGQDASADRRRSRPEGRLALRGQRV
jgi:DNA-binding transcriptional LysR family regulator